MINDIILVGTGLMAQEYCKVLKEMQCEFIVIGRGINSAAIFETTTGVKPVIGGFESYLKNYGLKKESIVLITTGTETLLCNLILAIKAGANKILIEKPAALSIDELLNCEIDIINSRSEIYVGYNRRFYKSVIEAKKIINRDGGLKTMHFEFTEWSHKIENLKKAPGVKENWFFANSTHVIDLAFYFASDPIELHTCVSKGKLSWHNNSSFVGSGKTDSDVLFSYISNWEGPGRWSIDLRTESYRLLLEPLEKLKIQIKGSLDFKEVELDYSIDELFKPGLFYQIDSFLNGKYENLVSIKKHIHNSKYIYSKINS
jgi:predicted dehydrogenase